MVRRPFHHSKLRWPSSQMRTDRHSAAAPSSRRGTKLSSLSRRDRNRLNRRVVRARADLRADSADHDHPTLRSRSMIAELVARSPPAGDCLVMRSAPHLSPHAMAQLGPHDNRCSLALRVVRVISMTCLPARSPAPRLRLRRHPVVLSPLNAFSRFRSQLEHCWNPRTESARRRRLG